MDQQEQLAVQKGIPPKHEEVEVELWRRIYEETRKGIDFQIANLNTQQQRILNVLTVNGLIIAFLGASASLFFEARIASWLYVGSMISLAVGLGAAGRALWPIIDPTAKGEAKTLAELEKSGLPTSPEPDWFFQPSKILYRGREVSKEQQQGIRQLLEDLSVSIACNAEQTNHTKVLQQRRRSIRIQLISIGGGVVLLLLALIFRLIGS
jgi:hypothetical protein